MAAADPPPEASPADPPRDTGRDRSRRKRRDPGTMIPARSRRPGIESFFMRIVATAGIVGIGVALAAILAGQKVDGWIVGLAVALTSVILSGVLWSSRQL
ncbi:MAG: hypothetical protein QOK31_1706 [Solirubrobacteraceae bacterium]|jgi:hypothetical protein|nr:hypothetical protein [Solirubrobacteraceae bacterium]